MTNVYKSLDQVYCGFDSPISISLRLKTFTNVVEELQWERQIENRADRMRTSKWGEKKFFTIYIDFCWSASKRSVVAGKRTRSLPIVELLWESLRISSILFKESSFFGSDSSGNTFATFLSVEWFTISYSSRNWPVVWLKSAYARFVEST